MVAGEKAGTVDTVGKYNDNITTSSAAGGSSSVDDCVSVSARSITHAALLDECVNSPTEALDRRGSRSSKG